MAFLRDPLLWLRVLSECPGKTYTGAPNFAYELCVKRMRAVAAAAAAGGRPQPAWLRDLDLSRVRHMLNGAEPVRHTTLQASVGSHLCHVALPR